MKTEKKNYIYFFSAHTLQKMFVFFFLALSVNKQEELSKCATLSHERGGLA